MLKICRLCFLSAVFILCSGICPSFAEDNLSSAANEGIFIPKGQQLSVILSDNVYIDIMQGDKINTILKNDFTYNNSLVAKKGSIINGVVVKNTKLGSTGKGRGIEIQFTNLTTQEGNSVPINGILKTTDGRGVLKLKIGAQNPKNILLSSGEIVDIYLTQPVTLFAPDEYKYEY